MTAIKGSKLYQHQIAHYVNDHLMHKVWDGTPWMVDAFTGSPRTDDRYCEIMEWCRDNLGPEAWPLHGTQGNWYSGGSTVDGWTWVGFATEEMMLKFIDAWPVPEGE